MQDSRGDLRSLYYLSYSSIFPDLFSSKTVASKSRVCEDEDRSGKIFAHP
jgi:hypothetical protein